MFLSSMTKNSFSTYIVIKKSFFFFGIFNKKFTLLYEIAFVYLLRDVISVYGNFTLARRMITWYNKK